MSLVTALREQLKDPNDKEQQKQREQLDFLLNTAKTKMALYKTELERMFLDPEAVGAVQIVGKRALNYYQEYRANVSSSIDSEITQVIDQFFTGSKDGIKEGFKTLIQIGLKTLLGDSSSGEQEVQQFYVVEEHNAIIRVDVKFWRYNFSATGIISSCQNAFCYLFCKSVVDHTKLTADEFVYLLSEQLQDNIELVTKYIDELKKAWGKVANQNTNEVLQNYIKNSNLDLV